MNTEVNTEQIGRGKPLRILYAEDHSLLREGMIPHLVKLRGGAEIIEASTAQEAARLAGNVDLVLLDLQMPGMNGFEGFDLIREAAPPLTPIVIVSGYADKRTINTALERGAAGFVPKIAGSKSLIRALEMVLDGERYIPNAALEESGAPSIFDQITRGRSALFESPIAKITEREIEILKLLANGQSNKQIAAKLAISPLTVKLHLRNGYKKLRANNRADAVRLAYEYGLITVPDSSG